MIVSFDKAEKEYRFNIKHGKVHIKKYLGNDAKVIIPEYIGDMPVTKIDWWAFLQNESLTEVVIPGTVKYIEYGAFGLCKNLKKVSFSSKVYLNGAAFVNSGLEEIEGLEYITGNASGRPFFDGTPFMEKQDFLVCDNILIRCITQEEVYKIPENIRAIGYQAFFGDAVKEVILPEGLKVIHNWAFAHTNITSFKIPDSVEVLEGSALTTYAKMAPIEEWSIPKDFGRRSEWRFEDFSEEVSVIHDTQFRVFSGRTKSTDERIYEDVSCISCGYNQFLMPMAKQTFPKRLEYLKHVSLLARARVNVFKTDDFKIGGFEPVFREHEGFLNPKNNTPRRFRIIFDLDESYGEIILYLPYLPWVKGHKPTKIYDFYNQCLNNGKESKFFDMELYDDCILEQDIPLKVKGEIAVLRCSSNYRLSDKAREKYQGFLKYHQKRFGKKGE
jgi:hypothetical protein